MKKIAFMFAVAAMAVACGNEVALTAEDSAAVENALNDSIAAEIAAVKAPEFVVNEGEDSAAVKAAFDAAVEQYSKDTAAIAATKEARLAANLAAALDAKKNAGENADSTENK